MMTSANLSLLPFEDLVVSITAKWRRDISNFEPELLGLVNVYITDAFGDSVQQYDLLSLTSAVNLMELKEQSKHLGDRLDEEVVKKLVYRLVRYLIQSQRIKVLNSQKFQAGLWKLGMNYEYQGGDSKKELDSTVALLCITGLFVTLTMYAMYLGSKSQSK